MQTTYIAIGFFKSSDGSSDIDSVNILGVFKEELQAQQACILYLKSIMVEIFMDRLDDEPNYAAEWLNKIETLPTIEVAQQLPNMRAIVEEIYNDGFGPQTRIEPTTIQNDV